MEYDNIGRLLPVIVERNVQTVDYAGITVQALTPKAFRCLMPGISMSDMWRTSILDKPPIQKSTEIPKVADW